MVNIACRQIARGRVAARCRGLATALSNAPPASPMELLKRLWHLRLLRQFCHSRRGKSLSPVWVGCPLFTVANASLSASDLRRRGCRMVCGAADRDACSGPSATASLRSPTAMRAALAPATVVVPLRRESAFQGPARASETPSDLGIYPACGRGDTRPAHDDCGRRERFVRTPRSMLGHVSLPFEQCLLQVSRGAF